MCTDLKLLDNIIIHKQLSLTNALVSSTDNRYCILVKDGLMVIQLYGYLNNCSPIMSFKKTFIPIPFTNETLDFEINIDDNILSLSRFQFYETVLNLDLDEEFKPNNNRNEQYIQAEWSPQGLIHNGHCVLASLTNTSNLNIYIRTLNEANYDEYVYVINIRKVCFEHFKSLWVNVPLDNTTLKLAELKRRLCELTLTCILWSHLIEFDGEKFCFLLVGHSNGDLTFWKFNSREANDVTDTGIEYSSCHKTGLDAISALYWHKSGNKALIFIGDAKGRVKMISVKYSENGSIGYEKELTLWNDADEITVDMFKVLICKEIMFIFVIKNNFMLTYMFSTSGKLLDTHGLNFNELKVTSIQKFDEDILYVLMLTGVIKEVKVNCENNKIFLQVHTIVPDFSRKNYDAYGLIISANKVYLGILVNNSKILKYKQNHVPTNLLIYTNCKISPTDTLMKNVSGSLENYWDCLEVVRLQCINKRELPTAELSLKLDNFALIHLKTYFWFSKISKVVSKRMPEINSEMLSGDTLNDIVTIKLIVKHMHHLLELFVARHKLSEFHLHTLYIANLYLKQLIVDDKITELGLSEDFVKELFNVISASRELKYPSTPMCFLCKKEITGLKCDPLHLDTRCSISMMQIVDLPYYKCTFCFRCVHIRLKEVYNTCLCPFCDIPLHLLSFIKRPCKTIPEISTATTNDSLEKSTTEECVT